MAAHRIASKTASYLCQVAEQPEPGVDRDIESDLKRLKLKEASASIYADGGKNRQKNTGPVQAMDLFLTQRCNFDCIYCYGDGGTYGNTTDMEKETALQAVDWLIGQSGNKKKLQIIFFGGEPLLNFTLLQETVDHAEQQAPKNGKKFAYAIATNGSLLTPEIAEYAKQYGIEIQISMDGPQDIQDRNRPFKNGKGSYKVVAQKIKCVSKSGVPVTCRATICNHTDPAIVKNGLRHLGFHKIRTVLASPRIDNSNPSTRNHERNWIDFAMMTKSETEQLLVLIKGRNMKTLSRLWKTSELGQYVERFLRNRTRFRKYFYCGAGKEYVAVVANGDIYLCHRFAGNSNFKLGSVFDGEPARQSYQQSQLLVQKRCFTCFARYFCGGGCYYDNFAVNGSMNQPAKDMCRIIRKQTELAAYLSAELTADDIAYLEKSQLISPKPWYDELF